MNTNTYMYCKWVQLTARGDEEDQGIPVLRGAGQAKDEIIYREITDW